MDPRSFRLPSLGMVAWAALALLTAKLLGLKGSSLWILFGGLILIGLVALGAYLWFEMRQREAESPKGQGTAAASGDELSQALSEADAKLRSSNLRKNAKLGSLPVVFLIGPQGSTKTTSMIHSGLDPELL